MAVVTNQPIQLSYFVPDIASALLSYNRLRWYRSRTGQNGLYEDATAATAQAATLDGSASATTPFQLNGRELKFRVNGTTEVAVTFTSSNPVTIAEVVGEINGATALVVASDENGGLRLVTVATGSGASIEILDGDANPFIGFQEGAGAVGLDQDTTLVAGTHEYFYTDQNSSGDFWYRVEFRHADEPQVSGLSVPFPAIQVQRVPSALTIVCFLRLTDMAGFPIACRRVTFFNPFLPNTVVDQANRWGVFRHYLQMTTDQNGYAQTRLLRGMTIDMSIDGTGFVRRIQIPSEGDGVDLLDPSLVVQDEFGIQEPEIDFAIRTS